MYSSREIETMSDVGEEPRPKEGPNKGDDSGYELET